MSFGFYGKSSSKPPEPEQQQNIRVKFRLQERSGIHGSYIIGASRYLNDRGVFIATDHILPTESIVDLRIVLPPKFTLVFATGRVVWVAKQEIQPEQFPGFAVRFIFMNDKDRDILKKFLG